LFSLRQGPGRQPFGKLAFDLLGLPVGMAANDKIGRRERRREKLM
jgi:hypothetical protein